jgi:hypothetical protein
VPQPNIEAKPIKILQISVSSSGTVYGLGDDQKMYYWDIELGRWYLDYKYDKAQL